MSADGVATVQRHVTVDRRRVRLVLARLDAGQPGLQHGQRGVGQGHPGHPDGGHRVQLRLRRGLMTQPPSGAVPDPVRVPVVGALLRRGLLAGQRGLRSEVEIVLTQTRPARGQPIRIGVQAHRLPLLLGGLACSADERLDVGLVLPFRRQGRLLGRRGSLDQLREVIDRCHDFLLGREKRCPILHGCRSGPPAPSTIRPPGSDGTGPPGKSHCGI